MIKNKAYRLDMVCTPEILDFFNKFANDRFADRSIDEISTGYLHSVAVALGGILACLPPFWQASLNFAAKSGTDSLYPGQHQFAGVSEFHNSAYDLLTLLENRTLLQDALEGPENQTLNIKNWQGEPSGTAGKFYSAGGQI